MPIDENTARAIWIAKMNSNNYVLHEWLERAEAALAEAEEAMPEAVNEQAICNQECHSSREGRGVCKLPKFHEGDCIYQYASDSWRAFLAIAEQEWTVEDNERFLLSSIPQRLVQRAIARACEKVARAAHDKHYWTQTSRENPASFKAYCEDLLDIAAQPEKE